MVDYIVVKGVVVGEYGWKRGASSYIVCMRIVPVVWSMIERLVVFGSVFEVMCNVLSISVCPLSSL